MSGAIFPQVPATFKVPSDEDRATEVSDLTMTNDEFAAVARKLVNIRTAARCIARLVPWWGKSRSTAWMKDIHRDCEAVSRFLYSKTPAMGTAKWPVDPLR